MKVFFINPPFPAGSYNREVRFQAVSPQKALHPPILLAYAAALCRKNGHEVMLIDAPAEDFDEAKSIGKVSEFAPELAVMLTSTASVKYDAEFAKKVREKTGAKTIAVGVHASSVPEDTLKRGFDIVAHAEYEQTILDIANGKNLKDVLGISYVENGKVFSNANRPHMTNADLDNLPFPAREFLPNKKYYSAIYKNPFTFVLAGRGCPFQCIYCAIPQVMAGRGYRIRSVGNVADELEYIRREYPYLKSILFNDDTLNVNKKYIIDLCDEIVRRKIKLPWAAYSRVDTVDDEIAAAMKKAGCFLVKVGFESGNDEMLRSMKKGTNIEQARKAVKIFKKHGIQIHGTFVFGMPGETNETIRQTIDFAKELDVDFVQFSVAQPYPGTEFYKYLEQKGYFNFNEWDEYLDDCGCIKPIFDYPNLSGADLEKWMKTAYKEYYFRPKYVAKAIKQRLTNWELFKTSLRSGMSLLNYLKE